MDQKTALETLIRLDNRRSYSVCVEEYHVIYSDNVARSHTEARVTIFTPGKSMQAVVAIQTNAPDLSAALAQAVQFIQSDNAK